LRRFNLREKENNNNNIIDSSFVKETSETNPVYICKYCVPDGIMISKVHDVTILGVDSDDVRLICKVVDGLLINQVHILVNKNHWNLSLLVVVQLLVIDLRVHLSRL
jgi:hypothetical protein